MFPIPKVVIELEITVFISIKKKKVKENDLLEQRRRSSIYPKTLVWKMNEKGNQTIPEVKKCKTSSSAFTKI